MTTRNDVVSNGCTLQWNIENVILGLLLEPGQRIQSPVFVIDVLKSTEWSLCFYIFGKEGQTNIGIFLNREEDCRGPQVIVINYQFAFLSEDGSLIAASQSKEGSFTKGDSGFSDFDAWSEIFRENSLIFQCTIWNIKEAPIKLKYLYTRTIFRMNRRSFVWTLKPDIRNELKVGIIGLDLDLKQGCHDWRCRKKNLLININYFDERLLYFSFKISIIDSEGKRENCGIHKYFVRDFKKGPLKFELILPSMLMENKSRYLPNGVLSLDCEYAYLTETTSFDFLRSGIMFSKLTEADTRNGERHVGEKKSQNPPVLVDDLKSMYNDGIYSDMELRTSTKTFPAHRNILSARSPVFRRMFSHDMKEKNIGFVDISDFEADTVHRMLQYMYTDSLGDLQFDSASKLYVAADYFEILSLKDRCSSFLKKNLCPTNACDGLLLADLHQDEDLKIAAENYILKHDEVFSSLEWKYFMDNNIKLAANVMYKKVNLGRSYPCNV